MYIGVGLEEDIRMYVGVGSRNAPRGGVQALKMKFSTTCAVLFSPKKPRFCDVMRISFFLYVIGMRPKR